MALTDLKFQYDVTGIAIMKLIFLLFLYLLYQCCVQHQVLTAPDLLQQLQNNKTILGKKSLIETQAASQFSYTVFPIHKAFQQTYGTEVPTRKNFL
jgi:hypothetical protein